MKSTIETLSIMGFVFGIVTIDVTPPAKAAWLRVLKFSLYSYPGSPTKAFISTNPGIKILSFKSIISASLLASVFFTFFPIAFTFPLSFKIKEPFSSMLCDGSIILALIKIFSFIYLQYFFKQAILTATPNSTCSLTKLTFMSSASFVSISTPLFIGPGCIISASFFANFNFSGVKP